MRKCKRPIIDIQRVPVGNKTLEELFVEVYEWIIENQDVMKSSDDTFVKEKNLHYNGNKKMISGGNDNDTAA